MSDFVVTLLGLTAIGGLAFFAGWRRPRTDGEGSLAADIDNLRTLLGAADESVMLLAADGTLLEINESGLRRFGMTREAMVGKSIFDLLPPELASSRRSALHTVIDTRRPLVGEDWRRGRCFAWRIHPVVEAGGDIRRVWVFAKDVTSERQVQALEAVFQQFDQRLLRHQTNLRQLAQHLCEELMPLFALRAVWIARQEAHGRLTFLAGAGAAVDEVAEHVLAAASAEPPVDIIHTALRHAEPCVVRAGTPEWEALPAAMRPAGCNLAAALPIYVADTVFGVLALHGRTAGEEMLLALFENVSTIASHASVAFEAAYDQSRLRLYEQALAATDTAVFITDREGHITWVNEAFVRVTGFTRREVIGRDPTLFNSGKHDPAYFNDMWETLRDGRVWRNDIVNRHFNGSNYVARQIISPVQGDEGNISHFVVLLEDVTDKKRMEERLTHLASHDPLTDLPNRLLFEQNLPRQLALTHRNHHRCAVLFVDLDRFKPVNDTYGHVIGDAILKAAASRLQAAVRLSDSVARYGGDEFVVVLPDIAAAGDAVPVAAKVLAACAEPIRVGEVEVVLGASVGIAIFPDDTEEDDVLVKFADEAMYRAKMEGGNAYRFHGG